MYGLPKNFPYKSFQRVRLIQVCVGENDLQLHFDNDISLLITSSVRLLKDGGNYSNFAAAATPVASLLGSEIVSSTSNGDKCLVLAFASDVLEIIDDSEKFESFVVKIGEQKFVI